MNDRFPLDHIVYAVPDLARAIADFKEATGITPLTGGRHPRQGTHNVLVNIGSGAYLEFIAADGDNKEVSPPRWMGVDLVSEPRVTRWAVKANDLDQDVKLLAAYNPALTALQSGERLTTKGELLRWRMSVPLPAPEVEPYPFLLDWSESAFHPTERMPEQAELIQLEVGCPEPQSKLLTGALFSGVKVVDSDVTRIVASLKTPKGILHLGGTPLGMPPRRK